MLSTDTDKLGLEITAAEKERDKHLSILRGQIQSYTSPFWDSKEGEAEEEGQYSPENHYYEYVSNTVPQLVYNNPRVALRSRMFGAEGDMTLMRYFMNTWIMDNSYGEFLDPVAHDICFGPGIILSTIEDHPYLMSTETEPAARVRQYRVSPRMYGRDPGSLEKDGSRFEFHEWHIDKEDLVKLAKDDPESWHMDEIKGLAPTSDTETPHRKEKTPDRKEVKCVDLWIRDAVMEDADEKGETTENGFNGVMVTLAYGKNGEGGQYVKIRPDRSFFGPEWGPYAYEMVHVVPDEPWGLAPLTATEGQTRDLNRHARAASDRAARRKRPIVVDESERGGIAEMLREAEDDEVLGIPAFDSSKIWSGEIGGVTDQDLTYLELSRQRLERVSGLSEAQRGIAGGADSATEAAIAAEGGSLRTEYVKLKFQRLVRKALRTVAWYFHHDERMRHVVSPEAAEELGIQLPPGDFLILEGGNPKIPFDQLAIEIEPLSMERVTTASNQRRMTEMFGLITQVAQLVPQMPYVKWEDLLDMMGEAYNIPRMGELIDLQAAEQMIGMQIAEPQGKESFPKQLVKTTQQSASPSKVSQSPFGGHSLGQETRQNLLGA